MDAYTTPWLKLSLLLLFLPLSFHLSQAADRLTGNQSLSGDQTLLSQQGVFRLGFFKPGNSSFYYIGMWYNRVSQQTIVWVANREIPVSDRFSSELRISGGNLVLFNESKIPIWSTNLNSTNNNSSLQAILLDNGNLVLNGSGGSNGSDPMWQSFDHPADTWLPGAKVGLNKITKQNTRLISWKNNDDPAPGLFSLELDPNLTSQYYILWNSSEIYWTSGTWNGLIFSLVPEMRLNYIYNFRYESNERENYFTYSLYNESLISRFVMDVGGQIQQTSWLVSTSNQWNMFWSKPSFQCQVYGYCGAFGICTENSQPFCSCLTGFDPRYDQEWSSGVFSGGCARRTDLQCANSSLLNAKKDRFLANANTVMPEKSVLVAVGSQQECESNCLSNCLCSAYAYENGQCLIWNGDLLQYQGTRDLLQDQGRRDHQYDGSRGTLYLKLADSEFSGSKTSKGVLVGAVVGSVVLAAAILGIVLFIILRKRRATTGKAVEGSLVAFGYRDLQNATKNFSNKLGGGGFGSVFKGVLPDSSAIAVKKLESISQGEKQFRTEVSTIGTIQHVNLVRLRGFCSEGLKKLLVYEYMPNGSLDFHLFKENEPKALDWKTRYNIALGTARGLTYLHEKCRDCIIHCDIKPENILLDAEFCPKVADFGLAKLMGRDFSRVLTTMRGTRGYLAPEWISGVAITAKADLYSYGMMLFEIVSGRRNSDHSGVKYVPSWVAKQIAEGGDVVGLLDPRLGGEADVEEVWRLCKVACWCVQDEEGQRPTMGQVVQILEGVINVNVPPVPRALQVFMDSQEHIVFFTESSSSQSSQSNTRSNASSGSSQANLQVLRENDRD